MHPMENNVCHTSVTCSPIALLFFFCFSAGIAAQEVSDTEVTDPGRLMVETGAVYSSDKEAIRRETLSVPPTAFRTGLRKNTELQVTWSGYQWKRVNYDDNEHGAGDSGVALKQLMFNETIQFPRTAVLVGTSVPTGSDDFSSDRFDPVALGIFEYSLGANVTTEVHAGVKWATETDEDGNEETDPNGVYAAAVYYSLNLDTDVFTEAFGTIPINGNGTPAHTLDVGIVHALNNDYEISTWYGRGLSDAAKDHFIATELTISF